MRHLFQSLVVLGALALTACPSKPAPSPEEKACNCAAPAPGGATPTGGTATPSPSPLAVKPAKVEPTSSAPHVQPLQPCEARDRLPIDAARAYYDEEKYEQALACAAQAGALFPGNVLAHTEKGNALVMLGRFDEAKQSFARALATDPDSLDALLGAAHLYGVDLPSNRENDELASLYAERGLELAREANDEETALQFGRLAAMIFNDLGQAADALDRADWVLARAPKDGDARYEKAMALFELCRFPEAKKAFSELLSDKTRAAHAHHHLGLILEREGKLAEAQKHLDLAHQLSAEDFPSPVLLSSDEFKGEVKKALETLPADMRKDVEGIPVDTADLPATDDLTSGDPPLSPTILGLFRGPPLQEPCEAEPNAKPGTPCRSVVLYRKNLARAVKSREELIEQIRVTLLHEIGHLRGEDDVELAARGLE